MYSQNQDLEKKLKDLEEKYNELQKENNHLQEEYLLSKFLLENSNEITLIKDENLKVVKVNNAYLKLIGKSEEEVLGKRGLEIFADSLNQENSQEYERLDKKALELEDGEVIRFEEQFFNGKEVLFFLSKKIPFSKGGKRYIASLSRDISPLMNAVKEVEDSERRLNSLIQNSSDLVNIMDPKGTIIYAGQSLEKILGYASTDRIGGSIFQFMHKEDIPKVQKAMKKLFERPDKEARAEFRMKKSDGSWIHMEAVGINMIDDPAIQGIVTNSRDITDRKIAEEKVLEGMHWLRYILDNMQSAVTIIDFDTKQILEANKEALRLLGLKKNEIIGKKCYDYVCFDGNGDCKFEGKLCKHRNSEGELERSDSSKFKALKNVATGEFNGQKLVIESFVDISEKEKIKEDLIHLNNELKKNREMLVKDAERLLMMNEKLTKQEHQLRESNAAKDKFFSILSHDLRSPLAGIQSLIQLLSLYYESMSEEEIQSIIESMESSSNNLSQLLDNLLNWSRTQTGTISYQPMTNDINGLINASISLFKEKANNKEIEVKCNAAPEKSTLVFSDLNMTTVILRNLISNAIKFTPRGGNIDINVFERETDVQISVQDSGVGMKEDDLDKIFRIDSRHTTPGTEKERGSGLGLTLCKEFVEKNNGIIWVESVLGKGSTFHFTIPKELNNEENMKKLEKFLINGISS